MAADEGKFGRLGEVRSCWCPQGVRPIVPKQQVRQYIYAYAAVAPSLGKMSCLILPYANTKMMNLFFQQVSSDFADHFVVMQVDRASWHRSSHLKIPENIRLIYQPSYSPQLMPVEHIWEDIREKHFYNHVYNSIDVVEEVLCQGLLELCSEPQRLSSLTRANASTTTSLDRNLV